MAFFKTIVQIIQLFQANNTLPQTQAAFQALVDSVVPNTPELSGKQDSIQSIGALDLHTDEFQIYILEHNVSLHFILMNFHIYLANATAEMLNIAASQLVSMGRNEKPLNTAVVSGKGVFAALEPTDRCRTISLLEQLQLDLEKLPVPFRNHPEIIVAMISVITMLTTGGYYSEWSGYGSTRLDPPGKRKIEHFPTGWKQVGYPGPSVGYHALRGYLIDKFTE